MQTEEQQQQQQQQQQLKIEKLCIRGLRIVFFAYSPFRTLDIVYNLFYKAVTEAWTGRLY